MHSYNNNNKYIYKYEVLIMETWNYLGIFSPKEWEVIFFTEKDNCLKNKLFSVYRTPVTIKCYQ